MNTKHTPWKVSFDPAVSAYSIHDQNGIGICELIIRDGDKANAEYIVTAVNAHKELIGALKNALVTFKPPLDSGIRAMMEKALKKAGAL